MQSRKLFTPLLSFPIQLGEARTRSLRCTIESVKTEITGCNPGSSSAVAWLGLSANARLGLSAVTWLGLSAVYPQFITDPFFLLI